MTLSPSLRRTTTLLLNGSIALIAAICAPACSSGSGGTPTADAPGVPTIDLHGDIPSAATRIFPDGAIITGAINHNGDVDWFRYEGVEGHTYAITFFGFPAPTPDIAFEQFQADFLVFTKQPDAATQLVNTSSTGAESGTGEISEPYDILPAGFEDAGFDVTGDHRIIWECPSSGTFYIKAQHEIFPGRGNYRMSLSSSQLGVTASTRINIGTRDFDIISDDDDPFQVFEGELDGFILGVGFEPRAGFAIVFALPVVFFMDQDGALEDEPEDPAIHLHRGIGHLDAVQALNFTDGDGHAFVVEFIADKTAGSLTKSADGSETWPLKVKDSSGKQLNVDGTFTLGQPQMMNGVMMRKGVVSLNVGDLAKGQTEIIDADVIRLLAGFEFYFDGHISTDSEDDLNELNNPNGNPTVLVSTDTYADVATVFETEMVLDPANVVPTPSFGNPVSVFYDSSIRTFQIAYQQYDPTGLIFPPFSQQHDYVGLPIRVHRGGPGQVGPVMIDLGLMPANTPPPESIDFIEEPQTGFRPEGPGLRIPLLQLTDAQAILLREAFYTSGFYLQISSPATGMGLARAEGFLEIQLDPNDPGKFGPAAKGRVSFETEYTGGGPVTLILNGKILGELDGAVTSLSDELYADDYYYRAIAEDGTEWDGIVTVPGNGSHETILLSAN